MDQKNDVCVNECKAFCCKHSLSHMVALDDQYSIDYWEQRAQKKIKLPNGILYIFESPCPQLKDNKCTIYENKPQFCTDYPLKKTAHSSWRYVCKLLQNKSKGQ